MEPEEFHPHKPSLLQSLILPQLFKVSEQFDSRHLKKTDKRKTPTWMYARQFCSRFWNWREKNKAWIYSTAKRKRKILKCLIVYAVQKNQNVAFYRLICACVQLHLLVPYCSFVQLILYFWASRLEAGRPVYPAAAQSAGQLN